jgi:hypothetical protein
MLGIMLYIVLLITAAAPTGDRDDAALFVYVQEARPDDCSRRGHSTWHFITGNVSAPFSSLFVVTAENGIYQDTSRGRSSEMLTGLAMFAEHPIWCKGNYPTTISAMLN